MTSISIVHARAHAALRAIYIADALSMPVHWYYNPLDIMRDFAGGIKKMEAAPRAHPSSIMALHSTHAGGRGAQGSVHPSVSIKEIVGGVILKGKRQYWGQTNQHYHQGMRAGENTLNAHCTRLVTRLLTQDEGRYNSEHFLDGYIAFMTADKPQHPDTYAESYHRGFFANLQAGKPKHKCGAITHDTPSVGGLVTIAPIAIAELLTDRDLTRVQAICREHLFLTHPDKLLAQVCDAYVALIDSLLFRDDSESTSEFLAAALANPMAISLQKLRAKNLSDHEVVGGVFSKACYITDSWPSLLYLADRYAETPADALLANTNLGGENCHRGSVLGVIVGLISADPLESLFNQLHDRVDIELEITRLLSAARQQLSSFNTGCESRNSIRIFR